MMGITIHFGGRLTELSRVREFTDELQAISETMGWPFRRFDDSWEEPVSLRFRQPGDWGSGIIGNAGLKGLSIHPHPESETFYFTFNREGFFDYPTRILLHFPPSAQHGTPHIWAKTQFAGPAVHVQMIRLLRFLQKKYIADLWVNDEAGFWESDDETELAGKMNFLNGAIQYFRHGLADGRSFDELLRDW